MAYIRQVNIEPTLTNAAFLPNGATLSAGLTTLFDGKILNADDTDTWETVGTGTAAYSANLINLPVTSGQWLVSQSRRRMPYFSGKTQIIEITCDNFETEANVVKRIGYFSSNAVSPYDTTYDGFWVEDNGTTKYLKCANLGTETVSIPLSSWGAEWQSYNFANFSVFQFYFLWLGGAALVSFGAITNQGFKLQTAASYVGTNTGMICSSPNQPVRYEIRSSTGTGNLRRICSQVATAGSIDESGKSIAVFNTTAIACNAVGTTYALLGIRKRTDRRDIAVKINAIRAGSEATSDSGILMLLRNPTLSAPLSYSNNSNFELALATTQTVSSNGRVISAFPLSIEGGGAELGIDYMTWLSMAIDDTRDEYVLAFRPLTANQNRAGVVQLMEYP